MPQKKILVGDDKKQTEEFLSDYFSETKAIPIFAKSQEDLRDAIQNMRPDVVMVLGEWVDENLAGAFKALQKENPATKFFSLGRGGAGAYKWNGVLDVPLDPKVFRTEFLATFTMPPKVKLLVVDDEEGILELFKDFFGLQKEPVFEVETAGNGLEGFKKVEAAAPEAIVLDIKMPVRNGIEFYADLKKSGRSIPTIVFIDSTSADEITSICKYGRPVFVEKSGPRSSMQELLGILKKLLIFS